MTFKRLLTGVLLSVFFVAAPENILAASFPDTAGTVYETSFGELKAKGAIQGYADGLARPNAPLNRAEALKVILSLDRTTKDRIAWYQGHLPAMPLFWDIDQAQWYAPYVEASFEKSIITGYPDGSLRPGQILRVEEAVALLMRTVGEGTGLGGNATLSPFIENQSQQWYTSAINGAIRRNLIMHQGRLRLGTAITRGQFFDMAYRLSVVRETNVASFSGAEPVIAAAIPPVAVTYATVPVSPRSTSTSALPYASEKYFAISIPSIGIQDLTITHPQDPFSKNGILEPLKYGVGHLFGYPGAGGKIMVYGHSSGYPWDLSQYTKIFRQINRLNVGDRVYITYSGSLYTYEVTQKQAVDAADTSPFNDNGNGEELILYTCWPPDSISQRYLVHTLPVGAAVAVR
ncbi:MAG: sortase [Candidatus Peribacteraceae bacterium]|nr:sortase [Candidatus Peribacteraceae bacterium]MDD5739836.1 sortase [Candidatus Peribacteraceae bacterium]